MIVLFVKCYVKAKHESRNSSNYEMKNNSNDNQFEAAKQSFNVKLNHLF